VVVVVVVVVVCLQLLQLVAMAKVTLWLMVVLLLTLRLCSVSSLLRRTQRQLVEWTVASQENPAPVSCHSL
jgi:hypothetical protein